MIKPLICAIAAMDKNRGIGMENRIPWDIPEDMDYLREVTKGMPLVMGSKTYESICASRSKSSGRKIDGQVERAMPGRLNVVVTRNKNYFANGLPDGVMVANAPKDGLNLAYDFAANAGIGKIFIFGGGAIYAALLLNTERLYLTEIDYEFECDAYFPELNPAEWRRIKHQTENNGEYKYAFNIYDKVSL